MLFLIAGRCCNYILYLYSELWSCQDYFYNCYTIFNCYEYIQYFMISLDVPGYYLNHTIHSSRNTQPHVLFLLVWITINIIESLKLRNNNVTLVGDVTIHPAVGDVENLFPKSHLKLSLINKLCYRLFKNKNVSVSLICILH